MAPFPYHSYQLSQKEEVYDHEEKESESGV